MTRSLVKIGLELHQITADYIHPCNSTESECLVKATQDAIPEFSKGIPYLGVPSLDPFIIDNLPIQLPGVKVTFLDGKVTGLRKCQVLNVEAYLEKNVFILEVRCNITIKGKYTAVGRLLLFPINGEGDSKIKIGNTVLRFLNENWRVVTEEFGQPVVDYAMNVTIETAKKFFDAVPYDELLYVPIPKY
ncbi:hypothetical protein RR46_01595 [Papilio xuthus]|uniref:Circadian clock-controlled protein n=1 Tax=Papilio xuthus TaxID=66420 RepID=A0A0N1I5B6_PAPXU|nr:hypothetical protein RR46_01595 [Papilio xuthus]